MFDGLKIKRYLYFKTAEVEGRLQQQASYDYAYHYAYMPDVIIFSKGGATYMKVEGVEEVIAVRRLN